MASSNRSSRQEVFCEKEKGVLKNFSKFTGKHLHQSLFINKVAGLLYWSLFLIKFIEHLLWLLL